MKSIENMKRHLIRWAENYLSLSHAARKRIIFDNKHPFLKEISCEEWDYLINQEFALKPDQNVRWVKIG